MSIQNERLSFPRWAAAPAALLICALFAAAPQAIRAQESKSSTKAKTKDALKLKVGKPVEREMADAQPHIYRLKLRAGEFARVAVEQRGVDVSLKLIGPKGERLIEVNDKKNREGSEELLFIAEAKGNYLLEVSATGETAAAAAARRYRVEVAELRAATEKDRDKISAERKMSEADQLRAEDKPESLRQAAAKYQEAIALWRAAGDRKREADALGGLGAAFSSLNEHRPARDQYNQQLEIRRALGDREGEANALDNLGSVHSSMRAYQQAIGFYDQSLAIRRELGDEQRQASTLGELGLIFYFLRDFEKAIDRCNQAITIWRKLKDAKQEATALLIIAVSCVALDKRRQSLEYFTRALALRRETKDRAGEGEMLLHLGSVSRDIGDNRKALEYWEAALAIWRALGNRAFEAQTLNSLGVVNRTLGNVEQALNHYRRAMELFRELKDQRREALLLNNLGSLYDSRGDKRKALDHYQQAIELHQVAKDRMGEASALNNIGGLYTTLGESERALDFYNRALPIWREINRRMEEGATLNNIGETYDRLGEKQQALDHYAQALSSVRAAGARQVEANILTNIGSVYSQLGEKQTAIDYYQRALAITRDTGDQAAEAHIYHLLGYHHYKFDDKQKALEYYNRTLPLWRKLGDKSGEAHELGSMGFVYGDLKEPQKALELLNQSLALHIEVGDRGGQSDTLTHMGIVHNDLGEREKAVEYLKQSLSLAQAVTDPHRQAKARFELARVQMALGDLAQARTQIEETLNLVEAIRSKVAGEHLRVAYFSTVQRYYDLYIELLMRMNERRQGQGFDGMALQAAERARARSLLDLLAEARADIRSGADPALLERERTLQTLLSGKAELQVRLRSAPRTQAEADALGKEIQTLAAEYQEVRARIRVVSPRYAALTQPQPLTLAEIQKDALDPDTLLLAYSLGEERSFLWAVTPTSINSYSLPKRDVIEEAARKAYELVSKPRASQPAEGEGWRLKHETKKEVEAGETTVLNDLSRMLLAPAAAQLGKKRLLIVADGALQYAPFAALPEPETRGQRDREKGRRGDKETRRQGKSAIRNPQSAIRNPQSAIRNPLVVNHEIVSLPSASTIAALRRELAGRQPAPKALAILADPVFEPDDERVKTAAPPAEKQSATAPPKVAEERALKHLKKSSEEKSGVARIDRLPYTRQEAEKISALVAEAERKESLDFEASRATATGADLAQYRLIHFATHGYLDTEQPELSALALSLVDERGARQNGFLRAHEIFNLKLPAELVTLSACETGLGKEIRGEGLIGLTRGFMYAGAARVVVSLWALNDRATAELMARFYRKMLKDGLRPAAALREAQVELSKETQWQAPYFWAGFTLQGEWR